LGSITVMPCGLDAYADELSALAARLPRKWLDGKQATLEAAEIRRRMLSLAEKMRRDGSVRANAKPLYSGGRAPVSGGREVMVVKTRRW
jgi:hypothetical protein